MVVAAKYYINVARNNICFDVYNGNEQIPFTAGNELFYAGCYVDAIIEAYYMPPKNVGSDRRSQRIGARLILLRFVSHGERFARAGLSDEQKMKMLGIENGKKLDHAQIAQQNHELAALIQEAQQQSEESFDELHNEATFQQPLQQQQLGQQQPVHQSHAQLHPEQQRQQRVRQALPQVSREQQQVQQQVQQYAQSPEDLRVQDYNDYRQVSQSQDSGANFDQGY